MNLYMIEIVNFFDFKVLFYYLGFMLDVINVF